MKKISLLIITSTLFLTACNNNQPTAIKQEETTSQKETTTEQVATVEQKTVYQNSQYSFNFKFPKDAQVAIIESSQNSNDSFTASICFNQEIEICGQGMGGSKELIIKKFSQLSSKIDFQSPKNLYRQIEEAYTLKDGQFSWPPAFMTNPQTKITKINGVDFYIIQDKYSLYHAMKNDILYTFRFTEVTSQTDIEKTLKAFQLN